MATGFLSPAHRWEQDLGPAERQFNAEAAEAGLDSEGLKEQIRETGRRDYGRVPEVDGLEPGEGDRSALLQIARVTSYQRTVERVLANAWVGSASFLRGGVLG